MTKNASAAGVVLLAILLRGALITYGTYQDAHSDLKYTDVDYRVFSDAARFVLHSEPDQQAQGWLPKRLQWTVGELSEVVY